MVDRVAGCSIYGPVVAPAADQITLNSGLSVLNPECREGMACLTSTPHKHTGLPILPQSSNKGIVTSLLISKIITNKRKAGGNIYECCENERHISPTGFSDQLCDGDTEVHFDQSQHPSFKERAADRGYGELCLSLDLTGPLPDECTCSF